LSKSKAFLSEAQRGHEAGIGARLAGHARERQLFVRFTSTGYGAYISEASRRGGVTTAYVLVAGKIDRAAFEREGTFATVIVGGEKGDQTACEKTFDAMEKEGVNGLIVSEAGDLLPFRQLIADLGTRWQTRKFHTARLA
jgi:hypothetical protein